MSLLLNLICYYSGKHTNEIYLSQQHSYKLPLTMQWMI